MPQTANLEFLEIEDMTAGVYIITNIVTGDRYVGKSKDVVARWQMHRKQMSDGTHPNRLIMELASVHGADSFNFELLEVCENGADDDLKSQEMRWIQQLKPELNFQGTDRGRELARQTWAEKRRRRVSNYWQRRKQRVSLPQSGSSQERAKAIMNAIVEQAQAIWGDDWLANLVRRYCEIERAEGIDPAKATPVNRRSQIIAALTGKEGKEKQNPKLETLLKLSEAVNGEITVTFTVTRTRKF